MQAHNLTFTSAEKPSDDAVEIGWVGTNGPGIPDGTWPRGELTGLPMMHAFTIRLPEEYQTQGPEYPAVAFFQGEGQFADDRDVDPADPFEEGVASATEHPTVRMLEDEIGGAFALIWLTEAEFTAGPKAPPTDTRRDGEHTDEDQGPNAWDTPVAQGPVWMTPRTDPNAGKAPNEDGDDGYQDPWDEGGSDWSDWAKPLSECEGHLGGTAFPVQAMPEDLTPTYIEVEEFGGLNFGGGVAQIDLESDTFDWACG